MSRRLLLVAASGLAREVAQAARAAGEDVVGFLDDDPARHGTTVDDVPVLGGLEAVHRYPDTTIVLCPGKGATRERIAARLREFGVGEDRYGSVVHPSVKVPSSCTIGTGSVLLAGVVLTTSVRLGQHVVVMPNVTLTHDDVVDDFATLCAGVQLGGSVRIGHSAYVGMAASVRERVHVGADAIVGMGAVVLQDVPPDQTWWGVPAIERPMGVGKTS